MHAFHQIRVELFSLNPNITHFLCYNMNICLSGVFGGYKVGTLARNGLGKGAVTDLFSII